MRNRSGELAKAGKDLMLKEPFYGFFLMMLNKVWDNSVPTAGVSIEGLNYRLSVNEEFWDLLDPDQRKGLMKHELLHIGFFHLTDFAHLTDPEVRNIAMDVEINQYIDVKWLPPGPVLLSTFPELKLQPRMGTNHYYKELMKAAQAGTSPNLNALIDAMKKQRQSGAGGGGSGNGKIKLPGGQEVQLPDHSKWKSMADLDEATQKMIKNQTGHILNQVADQVVKSRGVVPGEFEEILKRINHVEPSKFDWRTYLRRFAGGSVKVYTKKSRRKPSKRFAGSPGLKIKHRRHILVGIDTSGSVSTNELKEFLNELYHMTKTGTDVTVAQCDTRIAHLGPFDPKKDFEIHGRGGTDFEPVIDHYNENQHKYTCLIYLTDGEAPAPKPARGRMLWVLSSTSNKTNHLPGPTIQLN